MYGWENAEWEKSTYIVTKGVLLRLDIGSPPQNTAPLADAAPAFVAAVDCWPFQFSEELLGGFQHNYQALLVNRSSVVRLSEMSFRFGAAVAGTGAGVEGAAGRDGREGVIGA